MFVHEFSQVPTSGHCSQVQGQHTSGAGGMLLPPPPTIVPRPPPPEDVLPDVLHSSQFLHSISGQPFGHSGQAAQGGQGSGQRGG